MSIRARLVWLVIAVIAPALAFAIYATYSVYQSQSIRVAQSMEGTTRAVALAVDRELARYEAIVSTVAANPSLVQGDLRTFHARLIQTEQPLGAGVSVFDPDGIPLLDTDHPYGRPLPMPPTFPSLASFQDAPGVDVSPMFHDPDRRGYAVAIHRPVLRNGEIAYYVTMDFPAAGINAILSAQQLPERWLSVVLDHDFKIVARSREANRHIGQPASSDFIAELKRQPDSSGSTYSVSRDGEQLLTFYSHVGSTQWTVLIAIPRDDFTASVLRPIATAAIGISLVLAIAMALAVAVGRTITRPLARLDDAAAALAAGTLVEAKTTGMPETDRTAAALAHASITINRANQEMAERVAEALDQAERSHQALLQGQKLEALGRLTGGIAHDFNNVLQSMTVGLQLADMLCTHPRAKRAIEACQRSAQRGTQLTRQLLTFSRHRTSDVKHVDLRSLIQEMRELLNGARPGSIELSLALQEGTWPVVVDPLQCELAILNLAINARDAMPNGGALNIRLLEEELGPQNDHELTAGRYVLLQVVDTGSGMSAEVLGRAFEPFYSTKPMGAGTGLGLAQVYGFAKQSYGCVSIDSTVGEGTCVSILLPLAEEASVPEAKLQNDASRLRGDARILFVDDDAEVREVVGSMLEELGFTVEIANDGQSALQRLGATDQPRIDVVLSDIVMPGPIDGVGLADAARALHPELRILLASGYTERLPTDLGLRILAKPFSIEALSAALLVALGTDVALGAG